MKKKKFLNMLGSIAALVIFSVFILFLMFHFSTFSEDVIIENIKSQPEIIKLNILPILLSSLLVYGLCGRLSISFLVNFLFYTLIFIANQEKIIYRAETFKLADLFLGQEALFMSFSGSYGNERSATSILVVGLLFFIMVIYIFKDKKPLNIIHRSLLFLLSIIIGLVNFPRLYGAEKVYYDLDVIGNSYNIINHYNSKGTIYSVLYFAFLSKIEKPENYSYDHYKRLDEKSNLEKLERLKKEERPHIIWLMSEAFSEISQKDIFEFTEENDPNKNYKEIKKEAVIFGNIAVNSFGGGTADTEFDVLTGAQSMYFSPKSSASFHSINKPTDSIVSLFNKLGYKTRAFHPGYKWFYGRAGVYDNLGFSEKYFIEDIENPVNKGDYFSQEEYTNILLERFLDDIEKSDQPIFEYGVDIQNHGPYFYDKYKAVLPFESTIDLPVKTREILSSYFLGVKDIDTQLGRLYSTIEKLDEPVILVFYGDHVPGLGDGVSIHKQIEMEFNFEDFDQEKEYYKAPFLVTGNKAGREFLKYKTDFKNKQTLSASYLASLVLDSLGYSDLDYFFSFNSQMRKFSRIILPNYVYAGEEVYERSNISEEIKSRYQDYKGYQYYRIFK